MNCIILMGRLTADPELKTTSSGLEVLSFCIAVDRPTSKDAEKQADFINCVAWRQTAAFLANYFRKGDKLAVEGALQSRKWADKDGNNRTAYEVNVNRAHFCERKKDSAPGGVGAGYSAPVPSQYAPSVSGPGVEMEELGDEDLPF